MRSKAVSKKEIAKVEKKKNMNIIRGGRWIRGKIYLFCKTVENLKKSSFFKEISKN